MRSRLIVISGPSGVGKSSLIARLLYELPFLRLAVSATTRPKRPGEVEGQDYYFIDDKKFDDLLSEDAFVEWAYVHGNRNGTLKSEVKKAFTNGESLILDIDTQGARAVEKLYGSQAVLIFIEPPSLEELEKRLQARGTETPEVQALRLKNAQKEIEESTFYEYFVVNGDFQTTYLDLLAIITKETEI